MYCAEYKTLVLFGFIICRRQDLFCHSSFQKCIPEDNFRWKKGMDKKQNFLKTFYTCNFSIIQNYIYAWLLTPISQICGHRVGSLQGHGFHDATGVRESLWKLKSQY